jgi:autotransporter passenger strand-loop-strand repeat protein
LQSKAEIAREELAMTMYTAPPNQNGLVLGDGDVLQVNTGGTATNTIVDRGGEVDVAGGTAVNTTLDGGREIVESGGTCRIE